jgi:hypothetical protein
MRTDILNRIISRHRYKTYLEIGLGARHENFDRILCNIKVSVDPRPETRPDFVLTSDQFFAQNTSIFDLIFVDGLHEASQVYKDVENSLACLAPNGTIVCHDINPMEEYLQAMPRQQGMWTGDAWKAWVRLRARNDLEMYVIDHDYGCGVIRPAQTRPLLVTEELTWDGLVQNRQKWLNLVSLQHWWHFTTP